MRDDRWGMRWAIGGVAFLAPLVLPAGALAQAAPPALAGKAPAASAPAADPIARWNELWRRRDEPGVLAELKAMAKAFEATQDYEKLWRVVHLDFWLADGAKDDDAKEALGKHGWDVGKKALAIKPKGLAALYWTSVCIGKYSQAVGILNALMKGLEGKFRDPLLEVKQADPRHLDRDVDYVGPELTLGRYWYSLPWPKRSLGKSKAELEEAIQARPENLRAHFYLAQTLSKDGDDAGAKAQLKIVASGAAEYDPPEARRIKRRAAAWAATL